MDDPHTFRAGVSGGRTSVAGFRVLALDGNAGRVSWAGYEPGDGEVRVALSRSEIEHLPRVDHPQNTRVDDGTSPPWVI